MHSPPVALCSKALGDTNRLAIVRSYQMERSVDVCRNAKYISKEMKLSHMAGLSGRVKKRGLGRVDLSATKEGRPIYQKVGFVEKGKRYTQMRYAYENGR